MYVDDFVTSGDSDAAAPTRTIDLPQEDGPEGQDIVSVMPPTNDKGDDDIDNEQINRFVCFLLDFDFQNRSFLFKHVPGVSENNMQIWLGVERRECSSNQWLIDLELCIDG